LVLKGQRTGLILRLGYSPPRELGSIPFSRAVVQNAAGPWYCAAGVFGPALLYTKPSTPRTRVGGARHHPGVVGAPAACCLPSVPPVGGWGRLGASSWPHIRRWDRRQCCWRGFWPTGREGQKPAGFCPLGGAHRGAAGVCLYVPDGAAKRTPPKPVVLSLFVPRPPSVSNSLAPGHASAARGDGEHPPTTTTTPTHTHPHHHHRRHQRAQTPPQKSEAEAKAVLSTKFSRTACVWRRTALRCSRITFTIALCCWHSAQRSPAAWDSPVRFYR
jgi:hypothetical protein